MTVDRTITSFQPLRGLVLSAARIRMTPGDAQRSENFDYEKPPGARVRAGYARLLASDNSTVVKTVDAASRLISFERDDDQTKVVVARAAGMEDFETGDTEWT